MSPTLDRTRLVQDPWDHGTSVSGSHPTPTPTPPGGPQSRSFLVVALGLGTRSKRPNLWTTRAAIAAQVSQGS